MRNTMLKFRRSTALLAALLVALLSTQSFAASTSVTLYKNLQCTCCEAHAKYLDERGFKVEVKPVPDLHSINQKAGVPDALEGCHTSFIGGYVVIGHVPVDAIRKLLAERPKIVGISIPGMSSMPANLPGMPGTRSQPVAIYEITADGSPSKIFMTVP
ncbi:MAG TPA: DUF411 domain-containing protein [Nitrospiraceae bacterium]|nr:DUF411 domain-containing protein [Nitrospiraceae bacterium]